MIETKRITALTENESIFESRGVSRVKVTCDGKILALELPIKSTGVSDLIDTFSQNAPGPPGINLVVEPNSEIGRELGLTRRRIVKVPDLTDPKYLRDKEEHDRNMGISVLIQGLEIDIKDAEGNVVTDPDKAIVILKKQGMSSDQFMQIIDDITSLTKWSEEEISSFSAEDKTK